MRRVHSRREALRVGATIGLLTPLAALAEGTGKLIGSSPGVVIGGGSAPKSIPPLILETLAGAAAVAHVYNPGGGLVDVAGNAWTQVGTVPNVARQSLGFASGVFAAGFGPFSGANYFQLGTGPDVLDFSGNFLITIIAKANVGTSGVMLNDGRINGTPNTGYDAKASNPAGNTNCVFDMDNGTLGLSAGAAVATPFFLFSFGVNAGSGLTKLNSGAGNTIGGHTVQGDSVAPARLGVDQTASNAFAGVLIEMCAWAVAPTQAMMLSIHQSVTG